MVHGRSAAQGCVRAILTYLSGLQTVIAESSAAESRQKRDAEVCITAEYQALYIPCKFPEFGACS